MPAFQPLVDRAVALLVAIALLLTPSAALADRCATPGSAGSPAGVSGVVNTYFPGTASAAAGATSITVGTAVGASNGIAVGDLLLVIQMQDAQINSNNTNAYGNGSTTDAYGWGYTAIGQSGRYEYVRATSAVGTGGGTVNIVSEGGNGLVNAYNNAAATGTRGQRRFQVIRVPQYADLTLAGTITATPWNGTAGGVIAVDVANRLTFAGGSLNAAGAGFRGGGGRTLTGALLTLNTDYVTSAATATNASKGEGIAGTPRYLNNGGVLLDTGVEGYPNGSYARGAPGNAGGGGTDGNPTANDQNTGGGGGSNAGVGGQGGHAWCPTVPTGCSQSGGHPGIDVAERGIERLVMGGGGGAGTTNNGTGSPAAGFASSGAAGGGIIFVRAGEMTGSGAINANGADGNSTITNDSSGGGGGGGSVLLAAVRSVGGLALSVSANGGTGGSNNGGGAAHGPGGGGGGGFIIATSTVSYTGSTSGGAGGVTVNGGAFGNNYGATGGNGGVATVGVQSAIPGVSSGGECTPTIAKSFTGSEILSGGVSTLTLTVTNNNPDLALQGVNYTDSYPANLLNATPASPTTSCGGTVTAANGGNSLAATGASIAAAAQCIWTAQVTSGTTGARVNTIAAGGLLGNYAGGAANSTSNLTAASATLTVSSGLTVTKTSSPLSDPFNGTTNPKLIPAGRVLYRITTSFPAGSALQTSVIEVVDPTPAGLDLSVIDLGVAGSGPVTFGAGSSGLTYTWGGLASLTDSVDFSNNNGATWTYVPVANANGVDPAVTTIRIRPSGTMAAGTSFTLDFAYRIE